MDESKIKNLFFEFYRARKHKQTPDVSLIPSEHDPSALFTNSGMHPLKPYFLGLQKPPAKRMYNIQKCIRTGDIDEVGVDGRHLTFFFMLGNWSVGDYWVEEALPWAFELLTKGYGMDPKRLWASIYKGNKKLGIPRGAEDEKVCIKMGIPKDRIVALGDSDNFWASGATGPCGPTAELHYDLGKSIGCGKKTCKPGCDCDRFCEVWNPAVQIAYTKDAKGKLKKLKLRSIDGGAGLERIATVLQKQKDIFMTKSLKPLVIKIEQLTKKKYTKDTKAIRILADHLRASVFISAEGIQPGKQEREYVLRRLIRRMIKYGFTINLEKPRLEKLIDFVIDQFKADYPYLNKNRAMIHKTIGLEYDRFNSTLRKGNKLLDSVVRELKKSNKKVIPGKQVFNLYDTFGFPIELTRELAAEQDLKIDEAGYEREFAKHREASKGGMTKKFTSGLADHSDRVIQYHTATHLLNTALRKVLSKGAEQRGSNITETRIRYDFNWPEKLTKEQIKKVEGLVDGWIRQKLPITLKEMSQSEAIKFGAHGVFGHRYPPKVKVYIIKGISKEICMGPHVKNTSEIKGDFKITKQKSVAAGVRRVKAVLI